MRPLVLSLALVTFFAPSAARAQDAVLTKPALRIGSADGDSTQVLYGAGSAGRGSDGSIVVANGHTDFARVFSRGEHRDTLTYILFDLEGAPADTLGRYPGAEEFHLVGNEGAVRREIAFGRNSFAAVSGGRIAIGANDSYRFDIFNRTARRIATHEEPRTGAKVRREHIDALDREYLEGLPEQMRKATSLRMKEFPARETYGIYRRTLATAHDAVIVSNHPDLK